MKAHDLAKALLAAPNVPVVINGWGSDEGFTFEVTEVSPLGTCAYVGVDDSALTARDALGYQQPRECVTLYHGSPTPPSDKQLADEKKARLKAARLKRTNPELFAKLYAQIEPITPDQIIAMCGAEEKKP